MSNTTHPTTVSTTGSTLVAPPERILLLTSDDLPPEFKRGDRVSISHVHPVETGDYALASFGEAIGLRQVFYEPGGLVRLVSSEEVTCPASKVTILGRVMQRWRLYLSQASQEVKS